MSPDEFEDRYRALETLTVQLIRHMLVRGVFTEDEVGDLMGTLTNLAEGDDRATWCADRLVRKVVGGTRMSAGEALADRQERAERRARIYGGMPVPVDL